MIYDRFKSLVEKQLVPAAVITCGSEIDGIISPSLWPSYHQGGFQHPEICIFEPVGKVSVSVSNVKRGGGKKESKSYYSVFADELREMGLDPEKMFTLNPLIFDPLEKS